MGDPAIRSRFRVVHSDSISTRPMQTSAQGPSTPQTTAPAVICSGRDDKLGDLIIPTHAKRGLEGPPSL